MQKQLFSQWQQIGIFRWASLIKLVNEPEPKTNISSKTSPEKNKDTKILPYLIPPSPPSPKKTKKKPYMVLQGHNDQHSHFNLVLAKSYNSLLFTDSTNEFSNKTFKNVPF